MLQYPPISTPDAAGASLLVIRNLRLCFNREGENTQARLSTVISPSRRLWQWVARQSSGREMEPQAPVVHLGQSYYSGYRPPIASPGQAIALSYWSRYVTGSLYI